LNAPGFADIMAQCRFIQDEANRHANMNAASLPKDNPPKR
jgi:hypothetical protein